MHGARPPDPIRALTAAALVAFAVGCAGDSVVEAAAAGGCTLQLVAARTGEPLADVPIAAAPPRFAIDFRHSVLGTLVTDDYEIRRGGRIVLIAERFEGTGYGLPDSLDRDTRAVHDGAATRVLLERSVSPLVVRPSAEQQTRLRAGGTTRLLASLDRGPILFTATGCPAGAP